MRNVGANSFGGHGIYIKADLNAGIGGQASNCLILGCSAEGNYRSGLCIEGGDANIISVIGGDFSNNGDWGVEDHSFLGNTFAGIHTTGNADLHHPSRSGTTTHIVRYNNKNWLLRFEGRGAGSTTIPGTDEQVWTEYLEPVLYRGMNPPSWTNGINCRAGGPFLTSGHVAWSVWIGCYSEGNQGGSQMSYKAIVIGGDQGSGVYATDNVGTGKPIWLDGHDGELDLKTNLRVKNLYLGQTRSRPNGSVGFKMAAAESAPVASGVYTSTPYKDYGWEPGDIVWNQKPTSATDRLGWRCIGGPSDFVEIPWPGGAGSVGTDPSFNSVSANQFIVPAQGTISGYGGELYVRGGGVRIMNKEATQTFAQFTGATAQFPLLQTTAAGPNAFLDAGIGNSLYRSTSSARYKTEVEDVEEKYLENVLNLRPIWYRSLAVADDPALSWWGFLAEEVAEVDPRLVHWIYPEEAYEEVNVEFDAGNGQRAIRPERRLKPDAKNVPDGVQYDRLTVLQHGLIKRQKQEIDTLKEQLAELVDRIAALEAKEGRKPKE